MFKSNSVLLFIRLLAGHYIIGNNMLHLIIIGHANAVDTNLIIYNNKQYFIFLY